MAAGTSLLVIVILLAANVLGALPTAAFVATSIAIVVSVLGFYAAFRLGLNQRFRDASLTLPQVVVATLVLLGAMYGAERSRDVFVLLLLMVFLFGVLQFNTRTLLACALFVLAGYGVVIALLQLNKPQSLDLPLEMLQWLVLALVLPWFVWMGGHIKELRRQLHKRNAELEVALTKATASEANLAEAQRIAKLGMWIVDPVARSITWSTETYRLLGLDPENGVPVGHDFTRLVHPDDRQRYRDLICPALLEGRSFDSDFRVVLPSGEVRWLHALGRPVTDATGGTTMVRGTLRDITEQREADAHIRKLAHFDALTGLPNRSLFGHLLVNALARANRRSTPVALLYIDLDGFKVINDQFGHDAGDTVLAEFGQRLTATLRSSDATGRLEPSDCAARLGGDEFVVVIEDFSGIAQVVVVARKILAAVASPFRLGGETRPVGVSIGIALFPQDGDTSDRLIKSADRAMYAAKQAGKNTFRFFSATSEPSGTPLPETSAR
jgi:diguanylate cyclase (GGDEF)-like protein/PAS domain S-box-containing protein